MFELKIFRVHGQSARFRPLSRRHPVHFISIPLVIAWWGLIFFKGFFELADSFPLMCLLMFLLAVGSMGIFFGVQAAWQALVNMRLGKAEANLNSQTIQRGDDVVFTFRQTARTQTAIDTIRVQLVRHEWVRYQCGTNTCTLEHEEIIDEYTEEAQILKAGDDIRLKASFQIPRDAIHTFRSNNNHISWIITVKIGMRSWPDFYERYELDFPERSR